MSAQHDSDVTNAGARDLRRRDFVALSVATGVVASAGPAAAAPAGMPVVESNVRIATEDGSCDAAYFHPAQGRHPAVILWPDAFGLRPSMRAMGRRLASSGYSVLVPNPFYRIGPAPFFETAANVDFSDKATFAKIGPLMASIGASGAAEKDAIAFVKFLDDRPEVDAAKKVGTQGYCMGGALVLRTAAAVPGRVGAGASFHGGGLVTNKPDAPYTLAPRIRARLLIAIAASDDRQQPEAKDTLRKAFADAQVPARVEVFAEKHGWCVPDMPQDDGAPIYNQADAERAWSELLALYQSALA